MSRFQSILYCAYYIIFNFCTCAQTESSKLTVSCWIPYWKSQQAVQTASKHLDYFDQISPFSFEVNRDGTLIDRFSRNASLWNSLYTLCRSKKIKIVPTIFWSSPKAFHHVFSNHGPRTQHIDAILKKVLDGNFDGINLNYERIRLEDRDDYLTFLRTLSDKLHAQKKVLYCCFGGRTSDKPLKDKGRIKSEVSLAPGSAEEAQQFKSTIAACCDQIFLMGYDECGIPARHNKSDRDNEYYVSHASNKWIERIIRYALSYLPAEKISLGIPTYGLEFFGYHKPHSDHLSFKKVRNVKYPVAIDLAQREHATPHRTRGGEMSFVYKHNSGKLRYVCYFDAQSIKDKIDIAQKYGINGISIFKVDGFEDPDMWPLLHDLHIQKKRASSFFSRFF